MLDSVNKNCDTACTEPCKTCTDTATKCTSCIKGKFLDSDACGTNCDATHCEKCHATDANKCAECEEHYYIDSNVQCAECDQSCKACSAAGSSACTSCSSEKWYDSTAHTCTGMTNCAEMESDSDCKVCNNNYILTSGKKCIDASDLIDNCATMEDKDNCFACNSHYKVAADKKSCVECVANCAECDENGETCTECEEGYYVDTSESA